MNKEIRLIGISGKIKSGKDTVTKMFQYLTSKAQDKWSFEEYNKLNGLIGTYGYGYEPEWKNKKFADGLKQMIGLLTGCSVKDFESQEFKASHLPPEWDCNYFDDYKTTVKKYTYREALQYVGTDLLRNQFHNDVWVNCLFSKYKREELGEDRHKGEKYMVYGDYPKWIISDVRFPNEAKRIKELGGILILVKRPETDELAGNHISETALDDYSGFDEIIYNDSTLDELLNKTKSIIKKYNIK
ncbi:MAG: hypothetical protein ACOCVF_01985 [bacterium]